MDDKQIARLLEETQQVIISLRQDKAELKQQNETWQAVTDGGSNNEMSEIAKVLDYKHADKNKTIGRNTLFGILRGEDLLRYNNEPYQEYIDRGYFVIIYQNIANTGMINSKTLVTPKGLDYIRKLLDKLGHTQNAR